MEKTFDVTAAAAALSRLWNMATGKTATAAALKRLTGGLSQVSKMNCASWAISAALCGVGSKLAKIANTSCSICYAMKGNYQYPSVKAAHANRIAAYNADPSTWAAAMVVSIMQDARLYFRWFDSGDIQSVSQLRAIVWIAEQLRHVSFWLPTKETNIVAGYLAAFGPFPSNLVVRVSVPLVNQNPAILAARFGVTSGVHSQDAAARYGYTCTAPNTGNNCGPCRACWNPKHSHVSYLAH